MNYDKEKKCKCCDQTKALNEFRKQKGICKKCECLKAKQRRDADIVQYRKYLKDYRIKNPIIKHIGKKSDLYSDISYVNCEVCGSLRLKVNDRTLKCKKCKEINYKTYKVKYNELRKKSDSYKSYLENLRITRLSSKPITKCDVCNKPINFINKKWTRIHCSDECKKIADKRYDASHNSYKKRAESFKVMYEHVDKYKVFRRDKYTCKICKCKVNYKTPLKENSAELDHIIPMSKGGNHTYSNVQTLCRSCNNKKSDKYIGQLVLNL